MRYFRIILSILATAILAACSQFWLGSSAQKTVSSSLVNYLYPDGLKSPITQQTPLLQLPLRVGIAFVPGPRGAADQLPAATQQRLLGAVADHFKQREYISDIEVIPSTYLVAGTGFDGLDQVARLYGLDIIALVSYDQQSFTADTRASFWYWTIVGAYLVKGSENDISTFVDTAVFDIPTHSLLLRAPGTSQVSGKTTAVNVAEHLAESRVRGFEEAMEEMTRNLSAELDQLQARVEAGEATDMQVAHREGYSGGSGSIGLWLNALLACCLVARRRRVRASGNMLARE